jgi:hypothetical protein
MFGGHFLLWMYRSNSILGIFDPIPSPVSMLQINTKVEIADGGFFNQIRANKANFMVKINTFLG